MSLMYNRSKNLFVPPFHLNGMAERLDGNGKTVFARFKTVRSVLAPNMRSIISFLVRKAYTYILGKCSSPLPHLQSFASLFLLFTHPQMCIPGQNGNDENHVNGTEKLAFLTSTVNNSVNIVLVKQQ